MMVTGQIHYMVGVDHNTAAMWIQLIDGKALFQQPEWEVDLGNSTRCWIQLSRNTCYIRLPQVYSMLQRKDESTQRRVHHLEQAVLSAFGGSPFIRFDEMLLSEWQKEVGQQWSEFDNPIQTFSNWFRQSPWWDQRDYYFRDLTVQS